MVRICPQGTCRCRRAPPQVYARWRNACKTQARYRAHDVSFRAQKSPRVACGQKCQRLLQLQLDSRCDWQCFSANACFAALQWLVTLPRKGFAAYCRYLLEASHKKLVSDIDQDPWIWPSSPTKQKVVNMMQAMPKDQQAKNGLTTHSTRKRKMLTFSEVTDIVVEERVLNRSNKSEK